MKKIVMTGGGTAGHVTPNIALFDSLQKDGYEIYYIGSYEGIEKGLIEDKKIPYYGISSGKFLEKPDRSFPCASRLLSGKTPAGKDPSQCCLFQRWFCLCAGRYGSQDKTYPGHHP